MLGFVEAKLDELVRRSVTRIVHLAMAHVHADFPGRVLLCLRNGRGDPVMIQFAK